MSSLSQTIWNGQTSGRGYPGILSLSYPNSRQVPVDKKHMPVLDGKPAFILEEYKHLGYPGVMTSVVWKKTPTDKISFQGGRYWAQQFLLGPSTASCCVNKGVYLELWFSMHISVYRVFTMAWFLASLFMRNGDAHLLNTLKALV